MDWLKNNVFKAIGLPLGMSILTFGGTLINALADGVITDEELHTLVQSASGVEMVILMGVYWLVKKQK